LIDELVVLPEVEVPVPTRIAPDIPLFLASAVKTVAAPLPTPEPVETDKEPPKSPSLAPADAKMLPPEPLSIWSWANKDIDPASYAAEPTKTAK
jgi:hypothetical protein